MPLTLARRLFLAHLELSYRLGRRVTLAEFGGLVAKQMGRHAPFSAAAVSRWEAGTQIPSADVIEAIATVTHTDPGWISHGDRSAAPAPRLAGEAGARRAPRSGHNDLRAVDDAQHVHSEHPRKVTPKRRSE
jgi:transcriptional regulator with XRE-family HTH domain